MARAFAAGHRASARVAAPPVQVVDTSGAGDAFGAALLAWLYGRRALDLELALEAEQPRSLLGFACQVAALTCTRAGAQPPSEGKFPGPSPRQRRPNC